MARKPVEFELAAVPFPPTVYRAYVGYVHDADTYYCLLDFGLNVYGYESIRLADVNAPELSTPEGRAARDMVKLLIEGTVVLLATRKDRQTFGRYVADVRFQIGNGLLADLGDYLVAQGLAARVA